MSIINFTGKIVPNVALILEALKEYGADMDITYIIEYEKDTGDGKIETDLSQANVEAALLTAVSGSVSPENSIHCIDTDYVIDNFTKNIVCCPSKDISLNLPSLEIYECGHSITISNFSAYSINIDGDILGAESIATFVWSGKGWLNNISKSTGSITEKSYFQAIKNSSQLTTGTMEDLKGFDEDINTGDFTFDSVNGILKFNKDMIANISVHVRGLQSDGNRNQLNIQLLHEGNVVWGDEQYSSRNNTQNTGSAQFSNFILDVKNGEEIKLQVSDIGVSASIDNKMAKITVNEL